MLRSWEAPQGALGSEQKLSLAMEEYLVYVDPLRLFPSYRLNVIGSGWHYSMEFEIDSLNPKEFVEKCQVTWDADTVEVIHPDGVRMIFPAKAVLAPVGEKK